MFLNHLNSKSAEYLELSPSSLLEEGPTIADLSNHSGSDPTLSIQFQTSEPQHHLFQFLFNEHTEHVGPSHELLIGVLHDSQN